MTGTIGNEVSAAISFDEFDKTNYPQLGFTDFEGVAERTSTRRRILGHTLAFTPASFIIGTVALTPRWARVADHFGPTRRGQSARQLPQYA